MATKKRTSKKKIAVDWSDEDSVRTAMASELGCDQDDLTIEEDRGMSSFRAGDIYRVEHGNKEYYVAENNEVAHDLAVAIVKQYLEESPENFEPNFIESHIDLDHLRKELHSDVYDSNYDRLSDEAKTRPMRFIEENSLDVPEPTQAQLRKYADAMSDEDTSATDILAKLADMTAEDQWAEMGDEPEIPDSEVEKVAEGDTERQLENPVDYLKEIYDNEDAVKKAIEIGGIDVDAAADEAVSTDGEGHFLSSYDGHMHEGPGGIVWWRHN